MKTFSQLIPGDKIYWITKEKHFVSQQDNYGNQFHDGINFREKEVDNIQIDKNFMEINRSHNSYNNKWSSELSIPSSHYHLSVFEDEKTIFFLEEPDRDALMKDMVLKEIDRIEKEIDTFKNSSLRKINEIRKNYYSVLNRV